MAITSTATYSNQVVKQLSATYTPPTLTPLSSPELAQFTTDIAAAGVANADADIGAATLLASLETYFEGTYAPAPAGKLKLDPTATVTANLTITKLERLVDGANIMQTGTDVFRISVSAEYV